MRKKGLFKARGKRRIASIMNLYKWLAEQIRNYGKTILLRDKKESKMWGAMIVHVLKRNKENVFLSPSYSKLNEKRIFASFNLTQ